MPTFSEKADANILLILVCLCMYNALLMTSVTS
jgi:hypothetical protein